MKIKKYGVRKSAVITSTVIVGVVAGTFGLYASLNTHTSTDSAVQSSQQIFSNADSLVSKLTDIGLPCSSPQQIANPTAPGSTSMLDCTSLAGGVSEDTVVVVFDKWSSASNYSVQMSQMGLGPTYIVVAPVTLDGPSWAINTSNSTYANEISSALNGTVVSGD